MLLSNECWYKDECVKFNRSDAECKNNDIFCIKLFKLEQLFEASLLPKAQWKKEPLRLDESRIDEDIFVKLKDIQSSIVDFISKGNNLYLYSHITGNGKTAWAIRLLQCYLESIWTRSDLKCRALFISVPKYLLAIKDNISQYNEYASSIKDTVFDADLVVWDDIGTKTATSFEHENLLSIIDYRMNERKSNIFTSNLYPEELKAAAGDRLYSRIINYSTCFCFQGQDKRNIRNG